MSYKEIIDNVSNIEDLDNTTILKVLEKFAKTIKDFAIEQSGLNNLVNVEFIPSDNNTTYTGDSVDYLGTLKLTLSDNIIVNKPCSVKFNIKGSNTIVVNVDEFNNSLELHLDNSVITTLNFAESERQKSASDGAIVHVEQIADVEHIEVLYDKTSSDSNVNWGKTSGIYGGDVISGKDFSKYKKLIVYSYSLACILTTIIPLTSHNITLITGSYVGCNTGLSYDTSDLQCIKCSVNSSKTDFTVDAIGLFNTSGFSLRNETDGYLVYKIEGVY